MSTFSIVQHEDVQSSTLSTGSKLLFKDASSFSQFIEQTAINEERTCTSVLVEYCDDRDMEFEQIAKLVSPSLKGKLQKEFSDIGLLPEQSTLEV
jgi:hypothetical protein